MKFYLFSKEDGFKYYALIYSVNEQVASEFYESMTGCINQSPRCINDSQALNEMIYTSNLDGDEIDDLLLDIKKAENKKETLLILIDSKLIKD